MQLSIWEKETFFAPQDIIIIGSGFAGLWSALKLKERQPHANISIVERGIIPTGASTRNAGFSCFGSASELLHDIAAMGADQCLALVRLRYEGLLEIRRYFDDEMIGYDASGGYECLQAASPDWQLCSEQLQWLNQWLQPVTGIPDTFRMADEKLAVFGLNGFDHLIENPLEGGLHSGKLLQALLRKVQQLGVQVFTGLTVTALEAAAAEVLIHTDHALTLKAQQVLCCTNAFTKKLLPTLDIVPNRGQVFITSPIENFPLRGTFHYDQGYYYFRNLGNRLLIGGARNKAFAEEQTTAIEITDTIQQELEEFVQEHILPGRLLQITDRWSGIMAMGAEKLPIVQQVSDRVYCCVRMSGMGVALAPRVAGQIAAIMTKN